jgi:hypothetical protein
VHYDRPFAIANPSIPIFGFKQKSREAYMIYRHLSIWIFSY